MKRQALFYIGIYALIIAITAGFIPVWRVMDWHFFSWMHRGSAVPVADDVVIVDVPYDENLGAFRNRMTKLMTVMAEQPDDLPGIVVLDTWVSADTSGLGGLRNAVRRLIDERVPVYAGVNPTREGKPGQLDPDYMDRHAQSFYDMLNGKGHTRFSHIAGVIHYNPKLELASPGGSGTSFIQALPAIIARNHYNVPVTSEPVIVNLGDIEELRQRIYTFRSDAAGSTSFNPAYNGLNRAEGETAEAPSFRGKLVVVGSLHKDREKFEQLSGPEILSFAISERILPKGSILNPKALESPVLLFVIVVTSAGLSAILFRFLLLKLSFLRSNLWLTALLSMCAVLMLLVMWVLGLSMLNRVYTQVTLVAISTLVSTGLTWFAIRRDKEQKLIAPPAEESGKDGDDLHEYDVFISYARTSENLEWVKASLYEELQKLRKADGSKLRVFFDQRGIEPGEDWYRKLALAIEGSRFFIPVYTSDYFSRAFCQFEMKRAAPRHESLGDFIIPIARDDVEVPTQYDHIHYIDVRSDPDFMDRVIERIRKSIRVSKKGETK